MKRGFLKNKKIGVSTSGDREEIGNTKKQVIHDGAKPAAVEELLDKSVKKSSENENEALGKVKAGQTFIKLPFGKVDTALPANYEISKPDVVEYNSKTVDYPENQVIMTTLPPRSFEQTAVIGANGFAECLFQGGKQKRSILSIPGFPHSVPNFSPPRYRIGPSEHGQGMFATSKIEAGALIFAERPVLVTPRPIPIEISYPEGISQAEMIKIQLTEYEKVLEMCVDRMLPQDRKAFFELCDNHIEDGSGPILGRLRTNGFAIQIEEDKRSELHAGTFIAASRINHSCVPNVSRRFDRPSFSLQFYAVRAIEAGDELFVNYSGTTIPRSQRQTKLLPYGFQCTCPACSDPNFDVRLAWLMRSYETVCSRPFGLDNPQAALDESLFAIKEIEALGLESQIGYFEHLARGAAMAGMVGKMELSKRLSEKVEKMQMFATGKKFVDIAEAEFKQLQDQARETGGWVFKRF